VARSTANTDFGEVTGLGIACWKDISPSNRLQIFYPVIGTEAPKNLREFIKFNLEYDGGVAICQAINDKWDPSPRCWWTEQMLTDYEGMTITLHVTVREPDACDLVYMMVLMVIIVARHHCQ